MKSAVMPPNKNYFAMALKCFFMSLTEDELEFICHHYVHNWINEELQKSNRMLSKYQVESKLEYIKNNGTSVSGTNPSAEGIDVSKSGIELTSPLKTPSYMAPTVAKVQKLHDQMTPDAKEF
jgi:hypothetical protein